MRKWLAWTAPSTARVAITWKLEPITNCRFKGWVRLPIFPHSPHKARMAKKMGLSKVGLAKKFLRHEWAEGRIRGIHVEHATRLAGSPQSCWRLRHASCIWRSRPLSAELQSGRRETLSQLIPLGRRTPESEEVRTERLPEWQPY